MHDIFNDFISIDDNTDIPTKGKYSSKKDSFYQDLENIQKNKPIGKYNIRPIQFTFEITNKCNCQCPDCGMFANSINGKTHLEYGELHNLIDDLGRVGIVSFAVTGGEPFLEFDKMCDTIKYSSGKADIIKLISNGFWGRNPEYYFKKLEEAGLFKNEIFIPSLYISIGEQNVPLEHICNLIKYITDNYTFKDINFGIINTRHYGETYSQLEKLYDIYVNQYGDFPKNKVYLTDSFYVNSGSLSKLSCPKNTAYNLMNICDNDFKPSIGKFVSPKIFMKCNGDCYPCEVFNLHKEFYLGNYFKDGLDKVVDNLNKNIYVRFIHDYKTKGFCDVIPDYILKENYFETTCSACEFCIKFCHKNNLIQY